MDGPYVVVPNDTSDVRGFDVVRMSPTVIAKELYQGEAEALAFALNTQIRRIEGDLK
ncbi:hypothetical protein J2R95_003142 [Bradyrhizobium japonicum]|jgi:hypothetical protein|uniref:hypothetical protein n=1 Tax=Bradyrhizobium japonicum TaxID=375 RepID=UPI00209E3C2F|nr:hypothetical protein [Bradyrhizobium japonicum]MCP1937347.1 hypothetical protein [Bradyrhizobium japonicum]